MLVAELKRRKVFQVATAYMVVGWVVLQIASLFFDNFGAPAWVIRSFSLVIILGFPIACVIAWAFDATPEGVVKTEASDSPLQKPRWFDYMWGMLLLFTLLIVGANLYNDLTRGEQATAVVPGITIEASADELSIAVLPFDNLSTNEENAFFAAGVHEDILTHLSKMGGMKVISRTSVLNYGESDGRDMKEIGRALGVNHILEGSVRRAGNQVRITVQLIDALTDAHLWSENYDRTLDNIFQIQSEVAKAVAQQLHLELDVETLTRLEKPPTDNLLAYDLFLKSREYYLGESGRRKSFALLEQAIAVDPGFALAHANIASSLALSSQFGVEWRTVRERAYTAAETAIDLDPLLSEGHTALGNALLRDLKFSDAERSLKLAISLNSNSSFAYFSLSQVHNALGDERDALASLRRAVELNPANAVNKAFLSQMIRRVEGAETKTANSLLEQAAELAPDSFVVEMSLTAAAQARGDIRSALDHARSAVRVDPDNILAVSYLHWLLINIGQHDLGVELVQRAERIAPQHDATFQMKVLGLQARALAAGMPIEELEGGLLSEILQAWVEHNPGAANPLRYMGNNYARLAASAYRAGEQAAADALWLQAEDYFQRMLAPFQKSDGRYRYTDSDGSWGMQQYASGLIDIGQVERGRQIYRDLLADSAGMQGGSLGFVPLHRAVAYASLLEPDDMYAELEEAYSQGLVSVWLLDSYYAFEPYRGQSRYIEFRARVVARNLDAYNYVNQLVARDGFLVQ